ncbi:hypothetical protein HHI36_022726 [Cryptolaemus montrouzieri]|uniref:Uncharacterized protein n=1 Tax=Cryptolaemus montrouzieri TaxID=559131 RepID=A0ABD2N0L6_9CUCU
MDREELERRRIMAVLEESDSDVMSSDQESGEDDDHVSERSEATNTEQEISDDDEVPLATIRRRVQSEANLHQEEYASTSLSTRDCVRSHGNILVKMVRLGFESLFDRMFEQELKI